MVSTKCSSGLLWLAAALNLLYYSKCQAKFITTGDKYIAEPELTTVIPEQPQRDMPTEERTELPETDPCHPFHDVDFEKQEFYSPHFKGATTYNNNSNCVLVLEAPPGKLIQLDFRDEFHIEESPDCKNDYLEVRDGAHGYNKLLEKRFCGSDFPPMLISSDRHLWIHFQSDENIEYKGFKAVFNFIDRPPTSKTPEIIPCRIERTGLEEGVLGKSDIPKEILDFNIENGMPIDCIWTIQVRPNWRIQLQFEHFSLEKPNDCESNFVQVFSDRTDILSIEKTFCGSIADTVPSKNNTMFVRFFFEGNEKSESTFTANFTAYRDNDKNSKNYKEGCYDNEFDCEDATCISKSLLCNNRYNCRFRWDEEKDHCQSGKSLALNDEHIIIIMVIFSLILSGMCFTFIFNCVKKLIRDHNTIQEYIRQSREQQLNELDKQEQLDKHSSKSKRRSRSLHSSPSTDSRHFDSANAITTPCYVPGGELLPILVRNSEHSITPSGNGDAYHQDIYTVDQDNPPEMCDSACQTRESLFTTHGYSSGNSTPVHSIHTNSPPAPFSTFGYRKDNKFKAEAKIEMGSGNVNYQNKSNNYEEKRRPYSVQTTKSAPDVIVTH